MSDESTMAVCPKCGAKNRIPLDRSQDVPRCGKCKELLDLQNAYPGRPVNVAEPTFQREVIDFRGPVVVEFFAPW